MKKNRRRTLMLLISLGAVIVFLSLTPLRSFVIGWVKQEPFYRGYPANYWAHEFRKAEFWNNSQFDVVAYGPLGHIIYPDNKRPLSQYKPIAALYRIFKLGGVDFDGDLVTSGPNHLEAKPLLIALLSSDDSHVVSLACQGLGCMGAAAKDAVPALLKLWHRPISEPRKHTQPTSSSSFSNRTPGIKVSASRALWSIDPDRAAQAGMPSLADLAGAEIGDYNE